MYVLMKSLNLRFLEYSNQSLDVRLSLLQTIKSSKKIMWQVNKSTNSHWFFFTQKNTFISRKSLSFRFHSFMPKTRYLLNMRRRVKNDSLVLCRPEATPGKQSEALESQESLFNILNNHVHYEQAFSKY